MMLMPAKSSPEVRLLSICPEAQESLRNTTRQSQQETPNAS